MSVVPAREFKLKLKEYLWEPSITRLPSPVSLPDIASCHCLDVVADPAVPSNWEMLGCIAEGSSGRALSSASGVWDDITPSGCMSFCADLGYSLAGVEYSHGGSDLASFISVLIKIETRARVSA
jgi:hypothetical protein